MQGDVTAKIVSALSLNLNAVELGRIAGPRTNNVDALREANR